MAEAAPLSLSSLPSPSRRRHRRRKLHLPSQSQSPSPSPHDPSPPPRPHYPILSKFSPVAVSSGGYFRIAARLASAGRLSDLLLLAESSAGSGAGEVLTPAVASAAVAAAIDNGGRVGAVVDFIRRAEKFGVHVAANLGEPAIGAIAAVCRRLEKERRISELVDMVETLAGCGIPIKFIADPNAVLKQIIEMGDLEMAIRFASNFSQRQILLSAIMEESGKRRDLTSALHVFEELKKCTGGMNMFACRSIIDICGACGDFILSRKIFEDLLAQKLTPNAFVFNSLMNVNAHDLNYTFQLFRRMQELGVTADLATYNVLLKTCCNARRVDLAQSIYEEMKHKASKELFKLDVFTYSTMIKVFADAKLWNMALRIKMDMLSARIRLNLVAWSSLINACAHGCSIDEAIQVLKEMMLDGCEPNAQCFNIILDACVETHQYDKAFRLFNSWKNYGMELSECYKTEIECSNGNGMSLIQLNEGSNLLGSSSTVIHFTPTVASYNIMLKACGADVHRAKALLDEMKHSAIPPNHISWSIMINVCRKARDIRGAMQAFRKMKRFGIKRDVAAYTSIIKACVENKDTKTAFSLFEEMKMRSLKPNMETYNILLTARSKYGSLHEVQKCLAVYQEMRKAGYRSNDYYLKELIEEWCEGVLSADNREREVSRLEKSNMARRPYNLLLEKVAAHLQNDNDENRVIDIRGLTKIEGRIVLLSVLRMIKENYILGKDIQKNMIIVAGPATSYPATESPGPDTLDAVVTVLKDDLGLDVVGGHEGGRLGLLATTGPEVSQGGGSGDEDSLSGVLRRPQKFGLVTVTAESLHNWLGKKLAMPTKQ